jgi:hypothetical protein
VAGHPNQFDVIPLTRFGNHNAKYFEHFVQRASRNTAQIRRRRMKIWLDDKHLDFVHSMGDLKPPYPVRCDPYSVNGRRHDPGRAAAPTTSALKKCGLIIIVKRFFIEV